MLPRRYTLRRLAAAAAVLDLEIDTTIAPASLTTLVDSTLIAGRYLRDTADEG
ncbi:MAG TPA: hypothetical protein VGL87_08470 [Steroidobacteraceae bacterium]|jgi:hypothetical protein